MMPAPCAHVHSEAALQALAASSKASPFRTVVGSLREQAPDGCTPRFCGAEETRTPDFLLAKEALYQLSYGP